MNKLITWGYQQTGEEYRLTLNCPPHPLVLPPPGSPCKVKSFCQDMNMGSQEARERSSVCMRDTPNVCISASICIQEHLSNVRGWEEAGKLLQSIWVIYQIIFLDLAYIPWKAQLITGEMTNRYEKKKRERETDKMKIIKMLFPEDLRHVKTWRSRNLCIPFSLQDSLQQWRWIKDSRNKCLGY